MTKLVAVNVLLVAFAWPYGEAEGQGISYALPIGGFGNATTPGAAEGHAAADIIHSEGLYNQRSAAAMVSYEEARSKYIQNQRQWAELYFTSKRALELQRARATEEARTRNARYQEYKDSHLTSGLPPRLDRSQLDRSTGRIVWTSALMRDAFVVQRREMEDLLATQVQSGATSELSQAIVTKCREMHQQLRQHIRDIVTQEYLDAYKFLESLSLEGRFPLG